MKKICPPPHRPQKKLLRAEDRRPGPTSISDPHDGSIKRPFSIGAAIRDDSVSPPNQPTTAPLWAETDLASIIEASGDLHLQSVGGGPSSSHDDSINSNPRQNPSSLFSMGAPTRHSSLSPPNKPISAPPKLKTDERQTDPGSIFAHPPVPLTTNSDPISDLMLPSAQNKRITELLSERSRLKEQNPLLKEENSRLKEESPQLKKENIGLKEKSPSLKEENSRLKEESPQLKKKNIKLKKKKESSVAGQYSLYSTETPPTPGKGTTEPPNTSATKVKGLK